MKVHFVAADKDRERDVGAAFIEGVLRHGDEGDVVVKSASITDCDVAVMIGVKSRKLFRAYREAGSDVVMMDKGYFRHRLPGSKAWEYWRVAVNAHHPTDALDRDVSERRLERSGLELEPWRRKGKYIVIAGSSEKYHAFYDIPHPTEWAERLVEQIKATTAKPIIYRPKPSWKGARWIAGTFFSGADENLNALLDDAHCLVTHGSNACFEAVLRGVPSIILGNGVAKPISSTDIEDIDRPYLASMKDRRRWLANLLYWQWTEAEFASGQAWRRMRAEL